MNSPHSSLYDQMLDGLYSNQHNSCFSSDFDDNFSDLMNALPPETLDMEDSCSMFDDILSSNDFDFW